MFTRIFLFLTLLSANAQAQTDAMYRDLPMGNHPIGFKIVTFTDPSRVTKPLFNYYGEKETEDRSRKISVHLWYPAKAKTGNGTVTYGEYAINDLRTTTTETVAENRRIGKLNSQRASFEGFFGKISDEQWQAITSTPMRAQRDAKYSGEKFPLLIGMLRPLSTAVTNEMLASNGYVVAMIKHSGARYPLGYIEEIQDMQLAIHVISQLGIIDAEKIGTFGFSGSGFTQVAFAMQDPRILALADLESGFFMDGLFQQISSSNYYNAQRLKIPFLHLFGTDASREEVHISEFEKLRYSDRYRVILNQKKLHHWDFATEGRASTSVVNIRGDREKGIRMAYEVANYYLLNFFDAILKKGMSTGVLSSAAGWAKNYPDSVHTLLHLPALKAPPDKNEFLSIINRDGMDKGLVLAREIWKQDTLAEILHENMLNLMAQDFRREERRADAIAMQKFATELHPKKAWLWNNLASLQEDFGFPEDAIKSSEKVLELFADFTGTELSFNERIRRSSEVRLKRLKGL